MKANRVDARFVDHKSKKIMAVEMSCPWINNREKKDEEKTLKYGPLRWELKQQFLGYRVEQYNVIIEVLGGWSRDLDSTMRKMLGPRGRDVLLRTQRAVISSTLNIARTFKVITWNEATLDNIGCQTTLDIDNFMIIWMIIFMIIIIITEGTPLTQNGDFQEALWKLHIYT